MADFAYVSHKSLVIAIDPLKKKVVWRCALGTYLREEAKQNPVIHVQKVADKVVAEWEGGIAFIDPQKGKVIGYQAPILF